MESVKEKAVGFRTGTALVAGNMIGSGVFLLPASLALYGGISLAGWLLSAGGAIVLALIFSRLSRLHPKAGGPYAYTREAFGDFPGFLVAWGYWVSIWAGNAAIATAFVSYLSFFFPALNENPLLAGFTAVGTVWLLISVNGAGLRQAGRLQIVTTVLKVVPLLLMAFVGIFYINTDHFFPFNLSEQSDWSAISSVATLTLWAFLGMESATIPADDVREPEKTIPRATIAGTLLAAVVYIGSTTAVSGIIPPAELVQSAAPFADAAARIWGPDAAAFVAAVAAISCFGALNGWVLLQGQMPAAVAKDGLFPKVFARLSRRGTPDFAMIISGLFISILVALNYTKSLAEIFTFVILISTLTVLLPYVFCSLAEIMIRRRQNKELAGLPKAGLLLLSTAGFLYSVWAVGGAGEEVVYWGFLLLLSGIPVYVWTKRS